MSNDTREAGILTEETVTAWATTVFETVGMANGDAELAARILVEADLRGVYSHGAMRVPIYARRLRTGATNPEGRPFVVSDDGAALVVDGDNAMGQLVGQFAVDQGVQAAREHGVAAVAVRGSNHFGTCAYFVERAAKEGVIAYAGTMGGTNIMSPWGGAGRFLGNNPFGIAIPTGSKPTLVLDMALSIAARGKIVLAEKNHQQIPADWAFDTKGQPTTDPTEALAGTVRPLGDHKGYGLSLMVAMLAGILPDAAFGEDVTDLYSEFTRAQNVGHFFIFLDVNRFQDVDRFRQKVDAAIDFMHSSGKLSGNRVYVPGEIEHERALQQRTNGITYGAGVLEDLGNYATELGLPAPGADPAA